MPFTDWMRLSTTNATYKAISLDSIPARVDILHTPIA